MELETLETIPTGASYNFHPNQNENSEKQKILLSSISGCKGVVQRGGPVFTYYQVVPPRWGLVSSVFIHFRSPVV